MTVSDGPFFDEPAVKAKFSGILTGLLKGIRAMGFSELRESVDNMVGMLSDQVTELCDTTQQEALDYVNRLGWEHCERAMNLISARMKSTVVYTQYIENIVDKWACANTSDLAGETGVLTHGWAAIQKICDAGVNDIEGFYGTE
ncbi:hypothetical protein Micbo1qcDRAFT_178593 [Microdochium bolleyi]|uniref:Uncharacterized protein n=1 Tax=Microdochium bolleyi TaxID=196109 RepID=A0A136ISU4_9PEZI|nr:hypothetical protein Micbo1qcDRAFT_178593 [Microdochium bolleyi]